MKQFICKYKILCILQFIFILYASMFLFQGCTIEVKKINQDLFKQRAIYEFPKKAKTTEEILRSYNSLLEVYMKNYTLLDTLERMNKQ